jgi:hypothetical protein
MTRKRAGKSIAEQLSEQPSADEIRAAMERRRHGRARAELEATIRHLTRENEQLEAQVETVLQLDDYQPAPMRIPARATKAKDQVIPVIAASDWHIEERVRPASVNGLNEYSPEIAQHRARQFFARAIRLIDLQRAGASVKEAVLWIGGDIITGYIHEELVEENWLSPSEALLLAYEMFVGGIDHMLAEGDLATLHVACNYGNHGRTTPKSRIASGARNSYEWHLYHQLARHYRERGEKRVRFAIADGPSLYLDLAGFTLRTTHGDSFRYAGGIGGVLIPLAKAIRAWDSHRVADATLMGHWHQYTPSPRIVVNGSLIGPGVYSTSRVHALAEPPQQAFFTIHPARKAISSHAAIWVA